MKPSRDSMVIKPITRRDASNVQPVRMSPGFVELLSATARHYETAGYVEPWISYLAELDGIVVGACAFKSEPADNRVEIAYHTFPDYEGRGLATAMARELVNIARRHLPGIIVAAQTLPQRNSSHRILEKLGFTHVGEAIDHEAGNVWEWQLPPVKRTNAPEMDHRSDRGNAKARDE